MNFKTLNILVKTSTIAVTLCMGILSSTQANLTENEERELANLTRASELQKPIPTLSQEYSFGQMPLDDSGRSRGGMDEILVSYGEEELTVSPYLQQQAYDIMREYAPDDIKEKIIRINLENIRGIDPYNTLDVQNWFSKRLEELREKSKKQEVC